MVFLVVLSVILDNSIMRLTLGDPTAPAGEEAVAAAPGSSEKILSPAELQRLGVLEAVRDPTPDDMEQLRFKTSLFRVFDATTAACGCCCRLRCR
jgi:hypothetical protein